MLHYRVVSQAQPVLDRQDNIAQTDRHVSLQEVKHMPVERLCLLPVVISQNRDQDIHASRCEDYR